MENRGSNLNKSRNNLGAVVKTRNNANGVKKVNAKSSSVKRASSMHAVRTPKVVTIKKENKAPFPWSAVIICVLFTCMFLFMMMNYAEVNKYQNENASLDNKITSMQKQKDELQVAVNDKIDLGEIKEYASEQLGMVPGNQITNRKVITIEQGDKIEVRTYDDGDEGGFGFLLTGIGEVFRDFID